MYQFKEGINRTVFFWWDKKLIKNKNWAILPKSSKAVFPVIACHCNENGKAFPGERTIAILSGRTDKIVREGIRELENFPGFEVDQYVTKRGRKAKKFDIKFPKRIEKGQAFPFHKFIIEGGNWSLLVPTNK